MFQHRTTSQTYHLPGEVCDAGRSLDLPAPLSPHQTDGSTVENLVTVVDVTPQHEDPALAKEAKSRNSHSMISDLRVFSSLILTQPCSRADNLTSHHV